MRPKLDLEQLKWLQRETSKIALIPFCEFLFASLHCIGVRSTRDIYYLATNVMMTFKNAKMKGFVEFLPWALCNLCMYSFKKIESDLCLVSLVRDLLKGKFGYGENQLNSLCNLRNLSEMLIISCHLAQMFKVEHFQRAKQASAHSYFLPVL